MHVSPPLSLPDECGGAYMLSTVQIKFVVPCKIQLETKYKHIVSVSIMHVKFVFMIWFDFFQSSYLAKWLSLETLKYNAFNEKTNV